MTQLSEQALEAVSGLQDQYGSDRLEEALSRLELALEDEGWNRLGAQSQYDFSRSGLKKIIELSRAMFLSNPLIKNAVLIQTHYVWGQGVAITPKSQLIADQVVMPFLENRGNQRELTGHNARISKEIMLQTDGNLVLVLFTNKSTGAVRLRSVNVDQIADIVTNPEDSHEPWYYLREWEEKQLPGAGAVPAVPKLRKAYYPDWMYRPASKPAKLGDVEILWDSPIYHVAVGKTDDMRFGVPEVYAALPWARAVVQALEDYASIRRAHARFAWRLSTKGGPKGVSTAKTKLATTLSNDVNETNPAAVSGSTFVQAMDAANLEPIKTAGGQASPDEGRRVGLMVSAGTGIPETMLFGDSTVGNYATAKSLDRPTELEMRDRQELWANIFSDILDYVIDQAALRPNGPLKGKKSTDKYTSEVKVDILDPETKEPVDRRVDITFPNILERDIAEMVGAVVEAYTANGQGPASQAGPAGLLDAETALRLILTSFGERDIDEKLTQIMLNQPMPPAPDSGESGPALNPPEPAADTQLPTPEGPIDSPTAATSE